MAQSASSAVSNNRTGSNRRNGVQELEEVGVRENYSGVLAWHIADRNRLNIQEGITYYTSTGVAISHPTLLTKLRIMFLKSHYRNRSGKGPLWLAADFCSWLGIVAYEHPEISQHATDLRVQLQEMMVLNHAEFMQHVFYFLKDLIKKAETGNL